MREKGRQGFVHPAPYGGSDATLGQRVRQGGIYTRARNITSNPLGSASFSTCSQTHPGCAAETADRLELAVRRSRRRGFICSGQRRCYGGLHGVVPLYRWNHCRTRAPPGGAGCTGGRLARGPLYPSTSASIIDRPSALTYRRAHSGLTPLPRAPRRWPASPAAPVRGRRAHRHGRATARPDPARC